MQFVLAILLILDETWFVESLYWIVYYIKFIRVVTWDLFQSSDCFALKVLNIVTIWRRFQES
jgi:hypothetical protein